MNLWSKLQLLGFFSFTLLVSSCSNSSKEHQLAGSDNNTQNNGGNVEPKLADSRNHLSEASYGSFFSPKTNDELDGKKAADQIASKIKISTVGNNNIQPENSNEKHKVEQNSKSTNDASFKTYYFHSIANIDGKIAQQVKSKFKVTIVNSSCIPDSASIAINNIVDNNALREQGITITTFIQQQM